jgi:hypothetical protein
VKLKINKEGLSPGDICEITKDDRDGNPYALKKLGTSSVKTWFKQEHVDKVQRGGRSGAYTVGEKVQMRDGREDWKTGHVTSVSPLKVAFDHETSGKGYTWDEVRKH